MTELIEERHRSRIAQEGDGDFAAGVEATTELYPLDAALICMIKAAPPALQSRPLRVPAESPVRGRDAAR